MSHFNHCVGMKDVIGRESRSFQRVYKTSQDIAEAYGFSFIETPILEPTSLFIRSIGKGTDVVDKEMYTFDDKDGSKVCLRPEGTASVARAYITHGMQTAPQPVKVWYFGPMFRHDRPQAGRYRLFHQFGCETLGEHSPVIDAELITVGYNTLKDLGISTSVRINSIGTPEDRENYIVELVGYLRSKRSYLSEESKKRLLKKSIAYS
jgi:histidyl-tRNA synthetase